MKELENRILTDGKVLPGNILKVGNFLNHTLDPDLIMNMGREVARLYADAGVTKVLTVEASGIPFAFAIGAVMHIPVVFAKKHNTSNIDTGVYSACVHSYTHNTDYNIIVGKEHISSDDKVLLADDFLAVGNALNGLIEIVTNAGATVAGCAIAIEKGFQRGGDKLREKGIRVESLALIDSMDSERGIVYRP